MMLSAQGIESGWCHGRSVTVGAVGPWEGFGAQRPTARGCRRGTSRRLWRLISDLACRFWRGPAGMYLP